MQVTKSGFTAIVGRPNVGKSTLLNHILGQKIAIVSSKPQTTRNRITGVLTSGTVQMAFIDTPGLHRRRNKLDDYMSRAVENSLEDIDSVVFVIEPSDGAGTLETAMLKKLASKKVPVILAINKIDTVKKSDIAKAISLWSERFSFAGIVPLSAKSGDGIDALLDEIKRQMPDGPAYFPDDMTTDQPERLIVAEIIREKLLRLLSDEIPHGIAVSVEKMKDRGKIMDIEAVIYCEKDSHKGIIIGKGGRMLKNVGIKSREDIEKLLACQVNLKLWVKVKEDWRNRENILKTLGYD